MSTQPWPKLKLEPQVQICVTDVKFAEFAVDQGQNGQKKASFLVWYSIVHFNCVHFKFHVMDHSWYIDIYFSMCSFF